MAIRSRLIPAWKAQITNAPGVFLLNRHQTLPQTLTRFSFFYFTRFRASCAVPARAGPGSKAYPPGLSKNWGRTCGGCRLREGYDRFHPAQKSEKKRAALRGRKNKAAGTSKVAIRPGACGWLSLSAPLWFWAKAEAPPRSGHIAYYRSGALKISGGIGGANP